MTKQQLFKLALVLIILIKLTAAKVFADEPMRIISVQVMHQTAENIYHAIEPLVESPAVIRYQNNLIIIKATEEELSALKTLIKQLDKPLRQLTIDIVQSELSLQHRHKLRLCADIQTGDFSANLNCFDGTSGEWLISTHRSDDSKIQSVKVLEGEIAQVHVGSEIPFVSAIDFNSQNNAIGSIDYKPILTGFYVRPLITKDKVVLEISTVRSELARENGGKINKHSLVTKLRVPIDTWINLGGSSSNSLNTSKQILANTKDRNKSSTDLWIKVSAN